MSLPGRLINVDGIRIFTHTSGPEDGPTIALIHGYLVGHWEWRHVIPSLTDAGFRVVAFDLPGAGESDRPPPGEYGYDGAAFSQTLLGLLDALDIEKAHLMGHSMGGAVSVLTAARRPERVARLALVDPLVFPFRIPIEGQLMRIPVLGRELFRNLYSKRMIRRVLTRDIYRDPDLATNEWVDYLYERVRRPGGIEAAHATLLWTSRADDVARSLRAVRAPTLIVWGEDDRLFPVAWARRAAAEIPGAAVRILPACGHSPPEECPQDLVRAVLPFFESPGRAAWRATA